MEGIYVEDQILNAIGAQSLRRKGSWIIIDFPNGTRHLHHLQEPVFHADMLPESDYNFEGEVFLVPSGQCVTNIVWPSGTPPEEQLLDLMGLLETELSDWTGWPVSQAGDLV